LTGIICLILTTKDLLHLTVYPRPRKHAARAVIFIKEGLLLGLSRRLLPLSRPMLVPTDAPPIKPLVAPIAAPFPTFPAIAPPSTSVVHRIDDQNVYAIVSTP
jgi:hypothetical protein